jgi:GMP synthase (glutamine-hydrolysing)
LKTAVALRHLAFEDLGQLEPWLKRRGWHVHYYDVGVDEIWRIELSQVDLLVVLGGPIGAGDDQLYPYLTEEARLVSERMESGRAILGICLGAQIMARALGAAVGPMSKKEIGFGPLSISEAGMRSPLNSVGGQPVLHWHGDQFELPPGVQSLASTQACANQAFMSGRHALGLQFHLEIDAARIEQWLIGHSCELNQAGIDVVALRREAQVWHAGLAKALDGVMTQWLTGLGLA